MSKIVIQQLEMGAENCPSPLLEPELTTEPNISTVQTVPLATELSRHSVGRPPSSGDNCATKSWGFGKYDKIVFPALTAEFANRYATFTNVTATVEPNSEEFFGSIKWEKTNFPTSSVPGKTTFANATKTVGSNSGDSAQGFASQPTQIGRAHVWTPVTL